MRRQAAEKAADNRLAYCAFEGGIDRITVEPAIVI
jgi:hypothetical protein